MEQFELVSFHLEGLEETVTAVRRMVAPNSLLFTLRELDHKFLRSAVRETLQGDPVIHGSVDDPKAAFNSEQGHSWSRDNKLIANLQLCV